jgi:hypothetical protein
METTWFWLVAVMITAYVVLDGFDLGAGILHLLIANTEPERQVVLRAIGPVWDGNEVWLIAGGGTLYFAFPRLYASGFSGFYLPRPARAADPAIGSDRRRARDRRNQADRPTVGNQSTGAFGSSVAARSSRCSYGG